MLPLKQPATERILERFPNTKLDMNEETRELKWGKFGRYKYIYRKEDVKVLKECMSQMIGTFFPGSKIEYFT